MTCAPSEDSDQPGHPPSLFAWRKNGSLATHKAHSEDWSDWADAHRTFCWFCRAVAQIISVKLPIQGSSSKHTGGSLSYFHFTYSRFLAYQFFFDLTSIFSIINILIQYAKTRLPWENYSLLFFFICKHQYGKVKSQMTFLNFAHHAD